MNVLGIETSCDETSAAVVRDGHEVRSNVVSSQIALHQAHGGVVPELAARAQLTAIIPVVEAALAEAGMGLDQIDAIAVTRGPGLAGSLLVGANFAKTLAYTRSIPLVGVNHLEAHVYANWLTEPGVDPAAQPEFPILALLVSGGHTELMLMTGHGRYTHLGRTLDDAAGEAFDKGARLLGLGYPGGPAIQIAADGGRIDAFPLPRAWLGVSNDFSFSGLKTALLREVEPFRLPDEPAESEDDVPFRKHRPPRFGEGLPVSDLAASFQEAIVDVLSVKTATAAQVLEAPQVVLAGGVAANRALRERLAVEIDARSGAMLRVPALDVLHRQCRHGRCGWILRAPTWCASGLGDGCRLSPANWRNELVTNGAIPDGARELAVETALAAGTILRERLSLDRTIDYKGAIDLVTDVDRASEELIAASISSRFPHHRFVGEENTFISGGDTPSDSDLYSWLVDPLDGTTNYAHRYPHFAVSIALEHAGRVILGVVYDPMRDELFAAERGAGATLNGLPIAVSSIDSLERSLLGTGFAYSEEERRENARVWNGFLTIAQGVRRDGSAALNLCYVACGRLDGFWERPLNAWDLAAGSLLVEEAGGFVAGYHGTPFGPYRREILCSNGHIQQELSQQVSRLASTNG